METFLFITLAVFIDVLFPGPNFVITNSVARKEGPRQAFKLLYGILFACAIWCIFLFFGASFLFIKYPIFKIIIKIFGFIYILKLSINMIYINIKFLIKNTQNNILGGNYFRNGFINCILNPEVGLFYMAMFARIFDAYEINYIIIGLYSFEFLFIQFICFAFFIFIFSYSRNFNEKFMRYFDLFLAALLIVLLSRLGKGILVEILNVLT